jgi:hypothetical protein
MSYLNIDVEVFFLLFSPVLVLYECGLLITVLSTTYVTFDIIYTG